MKTCAMCGQPCPDNETICLACQPPSLGNAQVVVDGEELDCSIKGGAGVPGLIVAALRKHHDHPLDE